MANLEAPRDGRSHKRYMQSHSWHACGIDCARFFASAGQPAESTLFFLHFAARKPLGFVQLHVDELLRVPFSRSLCI
jgi:hypothetical protein